MGDELLSIDGTKQKVNALALINQSQKVYSFEVAHNHCFFVGDRGLLVLNKCHIKVFFEAYPHLKGIVSQVHHAIPQKVFDKWPELFDKSIMNSIDNLRGIPKENAFKLHQGAIHKEWNKFYKSFEKSGLKPTKEQVEAMTKKIDDVYGHLFNPPR